MKPRRRFVVGMSSVAASAVIALLSAAAMAQAPAAPQGPGRGQGAGRGAPPVVNLPPSPTAAALPAVSNLVTGPGPAYESVQSLAPGHESGPLQVRRA